MLWYAHYSEHKYVQKLALLVAASHLATISITEHELTGAYIIDWMGVIYGLFLWYQSIWREPTALAIVIISCLAISLHNIWGDEGLKHQIAYNLLYLSQLLILSFYGKRYGVEARLDENRTDHGHRFLCQKPLNR